MLNPAPYACAGAVDVVVIGAGHCGLAMSHFLTRRGIEHVVLERGEIANSWRKERWDSLRLLTPNWLNRLPGYDYDGDDPDGYMDMEELIAFINSYATAIDAPVYTRTTVRKVMSHGNGYRVLTDRGQWQCRAVVIASGASNEATVPAFSCAVPRHIHQLTAMQYRNAQQLPDGGVLVVGASATGLQFADEIQRSGRPTTLAVGEHVRMPRMYRGRDIQWWMLATGILDQRVDELDDTARLRRLPSPQLVGTSDHSTLDLNALTAGGVRIAGRLMGVRDGRALFSGSLTNVCALADLKLNRLLTTIDEWAANTGIAGDVEPAQRFAPTRVDATACSGLMLDGSAISTIVWATGFRPDYSWLDVPVLDRKGQLRHDRGVVDAPGLYVLGLPFMRRRKSSFIHGAEADARELCQSLAGYLDRTTRCAVTRIAV